VRIETFEQLINVGAGRLFPVSKAHQRKARNRYQQGEKNDSDNNNVSKNGLRMKIEMTMKEKRFSFFADPQERKAESRPTLHTLSSRSCQHTNQNLPKSATSNSQK
jgi:hypothetical protein